MRSRLLISLLAAAACRTGAPQHVAQTEAPAGGSPASSALTPPSAAGRFASAIGFGSDSRTSAAPGSTAPVARDSQTKRDTASSQPDSVAARTNGSARSTAPAPGVVRGIYVNRFAAQSTAKMHSLIALADSTEINAFVIDMKDEFGLNYDTHDSVAKRYAGRGGMVRNLPALLDTLRAHGILPIARLVVFKDSVTARVSPEWTIRTADGSAWHDKTGLTWVNPYHTELWDYNIRVAEELVHLGFGEIQWDYIRFPEPYKSLPDQVFPDADGRSKTEALTGFLTLAQQRLGKLGVRSTADIFGLVTSVKGTLEIGQSWEPLARVTDVLLPMVYPSHYPAGAFGSPKPNAEPYKIVHAAITEAHRRDQALGIEGEHVRPWLQAFTLGQPRYGATELAAQKQAVYDAGYQGWVLWDPGSKYDQVAAALAPKAKTGVATAARQ